MEEYIKIKGRTDVINLGTHEGLYNTRLDQIYELVTSGQAEQVPGSLPPERYLEPEIWRYRFPFPDEDGVDIGHFEPYDRGEIINLRRGGVKLHDVLINGEWKHNTITHNLGRININGIPCPYTPDFRKIGLSIDVITEPVVELVGTELMVGGREIWPVIRCPYCRSMIHLWNLLGGELYKAALHSDPVPFFSELAKRVKKGYTVRYNLSRYYGYYKDGNVNNFYL